MSNQPYEKNCIYCGLKIRMEQQKVTGYWIPLNLDNSPHECDRKKNAVNSNSNKTETKKVETKTLSLEELDARLKRVESIVIGERK